MYNLLDVFDCPNHGKVLSDETYIFDHINLENDEVMPIRHCDKCNREVKARTVEHEGKQLPVMEEVDDECARWANGYYNDLIKS